MRVNHNFPRPRKIGDKNSKIIFTQRLEIWIVNYFAGEPYRFLIIPLLGAAVIVSGIVYSVYIQKEHVPIGMGCFACLIVFSYLAAAYWYWNLIRLGKWKKIWRYMMHSFCPKQAVSMASGNAKPKPKINALVLLGCAFLIFATFAQPMGIPPNIKLISILVAFAFLIIGFGTMANRNRQGKK